MEEIIVKSEFPCLIINGNEQTFLEDNELLTINNSKSIYVYPVSRKNLFPFKIDFDSPSKFFRVFEHGQKKYCYLMQSNFISKSTIEKMKIDGKDLSITLNEKEIKYMLNDFSCNFPLSFSPNEYGCKHIEDFSVVILKNEKYEQLILFNVNDKSFKTYNGINFEIKDNEISFFHNYLDFSEIKQNITLKISKNKIEETKEEVNFNISNLNHKIVCHCFLDAVKSNNYYAAKKLLIEPKQDIDDEKFKNFFENFLSFYAIDETTFALFYPQETRILNFIISDGKISDFSFE